MGDMSESVHSDDRKVACGKRNLLGRHISANFLSPCSWCPSLPSPPRGHCQKSQSLLHLHILHLVGQQSVLRHQHPSCSAPGVISFICKCPQTNWRHIDVSLDHIIKSHETTQVAKVVLINLSRTHIREESTSTEFTPAGSLFMGSEHPAAVVLLKTPE